MNALVGSRTITFIRVTHSEADAQLPRMHIRIDWIGADGAEEYIERHGPAAALIIDDLRDVTRRGEIARHGYLFGFIRSHTLRRQGG
ncbi:MAG TPA: hypothetical protein VGH23_16315 [Rhizomicrobium sp.]|jgi:hypothetical protein